MLLVACGLKLKTYGFFSPIIIHALRRYCSRSHYQVLGVQDTASTEDIRKAFIEQSKKLHPDLNKHDPKTHEKFVRLNEAYGVLSKQLSRHDYDNELSIKQYRYPAHPHPQYHQNKREGVFWDESIYSMRDKSKDKYDTNQAYYGIKGVKKVTNAVIVYYCLMIIIFGAIIHFFAIGKSAALHKAVLDDRDRKYSAIHNQAKQRARENGNAAQLEILRLEMQKYENSDKKPSPTR